MTQYHYATLPVAEILPLFSHPLLHPADSYLSDDAIGNALNDLLHKGYRWIRTDGDHAIFEIAILPQPGRNDPLPVPP